MNPRFFRHVGGNIRAKGMWKLCRCICIAWSALNAHSGLQAALDMDSIHSVFGEDYEVLKEIPGRPWVEVQHRYKRDGILISCNFVAGRCLWIDYWSQGKKLEESFVFEELGRLFPGQKWTPIDESGNLRRWLNEDEDRLTLRSTGFTLHMNEYIRNVLSRRAQWQF